MEQELTAGLRKRQHDMRAEVLEVVLFAEKLGVIGGDRVDEALDLALSFRRNARAIAISSVCIPGPYTELRPAFP